MKHTNAVLLLLLALILPCFRTASCAYAENQAYAYTLDAATHAFQVSEGVEELVDCWMDLPFAPEIVLLPSTLRMIDTYALTAFDRVTEYRVADDSPFFKTVDGVLFTKDGSTLVAFPPQKGGAYTIPMGVTKVEIAAFSGNNYLRELVLPQGMESLPQGLFEREGGPAYTPPLTRLILSSTIRDVGAFRLACVTLEEIRVPQDHPFLYDLDGVLFSRDHTLIAYPLGKSDAYYDVPAGTLAIGAGAFRYHTALRGVSLPAGLKTIGRSAFWNCAYLESVSMPLTLESIGDRAFADCVHLSKIALPREVRLGENAFDNCPLLGFVSSDIPDAIDWKPRSIKALANPENSRQHVEILAEPKAGAASKGSVECGWYLEIVEQIGAYYKVVLHIPGRDGSDEGYVPVEQVQVVDYLQGLFEPLRVMAATGRDSIPSFSMESVSAGDKGIPFTLIPGQSLEVVGQSGQMLCINEGRWNYAFMRVNDVALFARDVPQGRHYGMVISSDTRDRLHLRNQPSKAGKSLGKFFSGTHVEILGEEGGWYKVRVGFDEGYMMKEFVREVKEWQEQ